MIRTLPPVHPNSLCSPRLGWDKFPAMPRPAKLPDLSDVEITELKLMILAVLERHGMGPEWRRSMRGAGRPLYSTSPNFAHASHCRQLTSNSAFAVSSVATRLSVRRLSGLLGKCNAQNHRRCSGPPQQRDELPPLHSITSSAMASSVCGTVRPRAFAVLRLMTSSNLVGNWTGKSAGFSPLRMRST